jgi:hypothetical protein
LKGVHKDMEEVLQRCKICNGQGKIRYRVWDSHSLIGHFIAYNRGHNLDQTKLYLKMLKIVCPLCGGDGIYDWIKAVRRRDVLKNFVFVSGNMDIYFAKCLTKWVPNPTHRMQWIKVCRMFRDKRKLIELSQRHYTNIKLNNKILSMSADELTDITKKCFDYSHRLLSISEENLTGSKIREIMKSVGLSDFEPDKFAYPGIYDYPS